LSGAPRGVGWIFERKSWRSVAAVRVSSSSSSDIPKDATCRLSDKNRTDGVYLLRTREMESLGNLSGARNNTTVNGTVNPFGRNEEIAKIEITVLTLTFLVAVAGNVSVLLATSRTPRKRSRVHLFIKHLSLADLVVAFFQVLPQLCWKITFRFYGPDVLCRVVKHLQVLGMFASTYMMVMMTLDRYIAVCHPLQTLRQPTRRAYTMIASTWLCSLALSLPQLFIFSLSEVQPGSDVYDCWGHFVKPWGVRAYITWITAGIFLVPVAVLVLCYGFICRAIWRNVHYKTRKSAAGSGTGTGTGTGTGALSNGERKGGLLAAGSVSSVSSISRAKLRTVKMTFVIVVAYVVCWAPFFTVQMWSVWDDTFSWDGRLVGSIFFVLLFLVCLVIV